MFDFHKTESDLRGGCERSGFDMMVSALLLIKMSDSQGCNSQMSSVSTLTMLLSQSPFWTFQFPYLQITDRVYTDNDL